MTVFLRTHVLRQQIGLPSTHQQLKPCQAGGHMMARAFPAILRKGPWPKLGKMIDLTLNLGESNDIEHNKDSKILPQNQVILDCIISSIPLKHKYLSIILIWVIVSHK